MNPRAEVFYRRDQGSEPALLSSPEDVDALIDELLTGVVCHSTGEFTEFPGPCEIPVGLVRRAVKEFLTSGGQRPTCVRWQVPEY